MNHELQQIISSFSQQPRRQDSIINQLHDLRLVAQRLGMYDAADYLRVALDRQQAALNEAKQRFLQHTKQHFAERRAK